MATHVARAKQAAEAIADKTLTNTQLQEYADAFAYTYQRGKTLNNEQKATVFINEMRKFAVGVVERWKIAVPMETARQTAAPSAKPDLGEEVVIP